MTEQERLAYTTQRFQALAQANLLNVHRPGIGMDAADALLWDSVKQFGLTIYNKAKLAREKYQFHPFGWAYPDWQAELQAGIAEHLLKGDPRDVAVYSMFAWFHGWPTAPATPASLAPGGGAGKPDGLLFMEWAERAGFAMEQEPTHSYFLNSHTQAARKGWRAALAAHPQPVVAGPTRLAELLGVLKQAEEALAGCCDVTEWPGDGSTACDNALGAIRAALAATPAAGPLAGAGATTSQAAAPVQKGGPDAA